jgi:adenylosuccinate synthase
MRPVAVVVADLGFGDAGKGTLTDWLVRRTGAQLVVRYNGGAQAGHTVVTQDGRRHTFSQLGAGAFAAGVRTHLSRFMVVHPGGLLAEARALEEVGVGDALSRLSIDPRARLISPFHQAAGRLREILRGADRHGSCGIGVGETVSDDLEYPEDSLRAGQLGDAPTLRRKLARIQARKWSEFAPHRQQLLENPQGSAEMALLESRHGAEDWIVQTAPLREQVHLESFRSDQSVVFEGAQGVLLDEWRGFHPYTTWSTCTFQNALELLQGWSGEVVRLGVLRSYATRHGAGPFPTEDAGLHWEEPHNLNGPWQGPFRVGWPDGVLIRYAIEACGGVDALALTHLDRLQPNWRLARAYAQADRLVPGPAQDLDYQESLTRFLLTAQPVYQEIRGEHFVSTLQDYTQTPVWVESYGPGPQHKRATAHCGLPQLAWT